MAELNIKEAGLAEERQVDDPQAAEFKKRAGMAKEPDMKSLKIGQRWDVFYPYFRVCEVMAVDGVSAVVKASQSGGEVPGKQWHETWAIRTITEKRKGGITEDVSHVVVVEDSRSQRAAQGTGTVIVAIDEKTKEQHRHDLSLVQAVLREDNAIQTEVTGSGQVQGDQQPDRKTNEQEVQDTQGGTEAVESPVRKRPGRPKGKQPSSVSTGTEAG